MPFSLAPDDAVTDLLDRLGVDAQRLAAGQPTGLPFPIVQQRAYELGRADGLFAAARAGESSLDGLGEALAACRALRSAGSHEDESALMRPYARGLWQGFCLLALESGERQSFSRLLAAVEPLRLANGARLEAEIDVHTTLARRLWLRAESAQEIRDLALVSARIAWLSDFAAQKARDRFVLLLAERSGRSDPSAVLRELRDRLLASAAVASGGDQAAHLRRQAFTYLNDEQLRQLFPARHAATL
jgi:hypothetical protein